MSTQFYLAGKEVDQQAAYPVWFQALRDNGENIIGWYRDPTVARLDITARRYTWEIPAENADEMTLQMAKLNSLLCRAYRRSIIDP